MRVFKPLGITTPGSLKGVTKESMGFDQVADYYLEWVHSYEEVVILWPEASVLSRKNEAFFLRVLGNLLTKAVTLANHDKVTQSRRLRLFVTLDEPFPDLARRVALYVGQDPQQTLPVATLFERHFKVIGWPVRASI